MQLLLAAAGDWISAIIPIVVFIVWVLNQVIGRLAQPQNPREMRRPPVPQQPPQPRAPQGRVEDEIEAFLRRAAQQRGQQRPAQPVPTAQPTAPRTLVQRSEPITSAARRAEGMVQAEMIEEEEGPAGMRGRTVSEHVQRHLDTREFQQRATTITKVDQADEQLEQRLHQAFDHDVGTLTAADDKKTAAAAAAAATANRVTAGGVFAMLKDPNSLRNAIILQEILRRPDER